MSLLLSAEAIAARLAAELPTWTYAEGHLQRTYRYNGWKSVLLAAGAVAHVAEAAWHHPELTLGYGQLQVRLQTHDAGGVTAKDFALAIQIEAVLTWQPPVASGLEGTPDDPRYAYRLP